MKTIPLILILMKCSHCVKCRKLSYWFNKKLVKKGLPTKIQKALGICRVVGNHSVHPEQIDLNDKPEIALNLFVIINQIVELMISQPANIDNLYDGVLSKDSKKQIEERDKGSKLLGYKLKCDLRAFSCVY